MSETTSGQSERYQRVLPLSFQERDGHVTIYCMAAECHWSWPLYSGSVDANGRTVEAAVKHSLDRHSE